LKEDAKQRAVITMNSNQPRDIKRCVSRPYRLRGKAGNGWGITDTRTIRSHRGVGDGTL
jgi:hypothetical protein